ncbi:MAG: ChaN family lipoprotein [Pleurocapsa sp. MO_192.B19]|nr:ChaN family lipoprotein [Pleurocapsa sp. MO_192.B19]
MNLKFPVLIYFVGVFLVGFFWIKYPNELVSVAEPLTHASQEEQVINQLKQNDVIYLAENHDRLEDHASQLKIITQLYQERTDSNTDNAELAIALEMFQRPFQPRLNRYLAKQINETELQEQTEYDTRWGFDWEYYAPILRFAQENQIPLIALNTPTEITRKVAENSLNSLEKSDFRYIPPLAEIKLDNQEYRQKLQEVYQQHTQNGQGNSDGFENFFAVQVLWDETMAEAIAFYYQNNPQSQIVVLVGQGHIIDNYGIPDRVTRRINDPSFKQTSVMLEKNRTVLE